MKDTVLKHRSTFSCEMLDEFYFHCVSRIAAKNKWRNIRYHREANQGHLGKMRQDSPGRQETDFLHDKFNTVLR